MGLEVGGRGVADEDGSGPVGGILVCGGPADADWGVGARYNCDLAVVVVRDRAMRTGVYSIARILTLPDVCLPKKAPHGVCVGCSRILLQTGYLVQVASRERRAFAYQL